MNKLNISLWIGICLIIFMLLLSLVSYVYTPYDPNSMNIGSRLLGPSPMNWLGTDQFGRDTISRIMVGGRMALIVSSCSVSFGAFIGFVLGAVAAIQKGIIGGTIMRFLDALIAFPGILLAMMLVVVMGRGEETTVIAIGIFIVPVFARLVNGLVLESESLLYLKAAQSFGASKIYLLFRHILPDIVPRLITQLSSSMGFSVLLESSLSFLGLGVQPPHASWGVMLSEARQFITSYPFLPVMPGIAIILTVLGFNLIGDGLNDQLINRREG